MSVNSTRTIWKVHAEGGSWSDFQEGTWLFTNKRAADAFVRKLEAIFAARIDVEIDTHELEVYKFAWAAQEDGFWPFGR